MNVFGIALAAFIGGVAVALLGWLDAHESFDPKKFGSSVIRALGAAVVFAIAYTYTNGITPIDIGIAFIGGMGIDAAGNRIAGAIKNGK